MNTERPNAESESAGVMNGHPAIIDQVAKAKVGAPPPMAVSAESEAHRAPKSDRDPLRFVTPEVRERKLQVVTAGLGVVFLFSGLTKLLGAEFQAVLFERFGFSTAVLMTVGALEVLFAVLVVIKATRPWGAMGLAVLMGGAAMTHIMTGVLMPLIFANVVLFPASVWVVIKQRPGFLKLR